MSLVALGAAVLQRPIHLEPSILNILKEVVLALPAYFSGMTQSALTLERRIQAEKEGSDVARFPESLLG